jgi:hypothetical protein
MKYIIILFLLINCINRSVIENQDAKINNIILPFILNEALKKECKNTNENTDCL